MEKRDLKYGNVVETRNGLKFLYIGNSNLNLKTDFLRLDREDYDLLVSHYRNDFTYIYRNLQHLDIMKVYQDYTCKELLWERKEKPKPTEDEKTILRNIDEEYKWISRDKDGELWVYQIKPTKLKNEEMWDCYNKETYHHKTCSEILTCFTTIFKFIKWEDNEPYLIEDLLKGENND